MKDNRKRIFAGLLAAVMAVSMLPVSAFAAEEGNNEPVPVAVSSADYTEEQTVEGIPEQGTEEAAQDPTNVKDPDEGIAESGKEEPTDAQEEQTDVQEVSWFHRSRVRSNSDNLRMDVITGLLLLI